MKTYKEFILEAIDVYERYYEPDEKLPSGRTPLGNANRSYKRQYDKYFSTPDKERKLEDIKRITRQGRNINKYVSHGADNPSLNRHSQQGVDVSGDRNSIRISHPESGIRYTVRKVGKTEDNSSVYNVDWEHHHQPSTLDNKQKIKIGRNAKDVWDTHVQHRLPHGAVLRNSPVPNPTEKNPNKNTRARLYQKAGFGEPARRGQFAKVGREPSTKRKLKGQTRLSPLPSNIIYKFD